MIQSNTQLKKQSNLKLTEPNNFNDISFTTWSDLDLSKCIPPATDVIFMPPILSCWQFIYENRMYQMEIRLTLGL
jgi:hypothetical protein